MSSRLIAMALASCFTWMLTPAPADTPATASGTVLSPAGEPVDGAEVIVATPSRAAWPNVPPDKRDPSRRGAGTTHTDKSGRFTIHLPKDTGLLSIHHPQVGYAEVRPGTLATTPRVTLEPWCRLEGVVKVGSKPVEGVEVQLSNFWWRDDPAVTEYGGAPVKTDARGGYAFERVPKGVVGVYVRVSEHGPSLNRFTATRPEKPGRLDIGGTGRRVVAKFIPRGGGGAEGKDKGVLMYGHFRRRVPPFDPPPLAAGTSAQDQQEALRAWLQTPQAEDKYAARHEYTIMLGEQGTMQLDDVPPGEYELMIRLDRAGTKAGRIRNNIVVPAGPAQEAFDLGQIEVGDGRGL